MRQAVYTVNNHDGQWAISYNGKEFGPWPNEAGAVAAAVAAAKKAAQQGISGEVLVNQPSDSLRRRVAQGFYTASS